MPGILRIYKQALSNTDAPRHAGGQCQQEGGPAAQEDRQPGEQAPGHRTAHRTGPGPAGIAQTETVVTRAPTLPSSGRGVCI